MSQGGIKIEFAGNAATKFGIIIIGIALVGLIGGNQAVALLERTGAIPQKPVPTEPSSAGSSERVDWARRGEIIDAVPLSHREIANATQNLAIAIHAMQASVARLEDDIRQHDIDTRRSGN